MIGIPKDTPLRIERVANGYIVEPERRFQEASVPLCKEDVFVFNELRHAFEFMERHFPGTLGKPERTP